MEETQPGDGTDPLLSMGWFRTGGTFLYRVLAKGLPSTEHFYEPFNPMIPQYFQDVSAEQEEVEENRALFDPYNPHREMIEEWFDPAFGRQHFFLDGEERLGEMDRYLVELAASGDPVHFQMTRGLGRVDYLRGLFPSARSLLIIRSPWATWSAWHGKPESAYADDLPDDKFQQKTMLRELTIRLPDESLQYWGLEGHDTSHPFDTFLGLWGFLHYLTLQQIDDFDRFHVLRYEDLVREWEPSLRLIEEDLEISLERDNLPEPPEGTVDRGQNIFSEAEVNQALERIPSESPLRSMLEQFEYV